MISLGHNITTPQDPLVKITIDEFYQHIQTPSEAFVTQLHQLQTIRTIDASKYNALKRQLPYVVCGIFNPPIRHSDNFAYIEYFMLDIDHISSKGLDVDLLRLQLESDERVLLSFISPSHDGLKLLFRLSTRCYDKGIYSLFYKLFAQQFSNQYHLEQVIDSKTSDVTRACFLSADPQAYYNPKAQPIDLSVYVPQGNPSAMNELQRDLFAAEKSAAKQNVQQETTAEPKPDVTTEVIDKIKAILNPNARVVPPKQIYVPEQLEDLMSELVQYITSTGIEVTEVIDINYGKKVRMALQRRTAEVNIFYGKRGYSVVTSPRSGTDAELNKLLTELIQNYIYSPRL